MANPKFGLRDLFWLAAVVAMAAGWWSDRWRVAEENSLLWHSMKTGEGVLIGDIFFTPRCSEEADDQSEL